MKYKLDYLFISIIAFFCVFFVFNKITYNSDFIAYMGVVNGYDNNSKKAHEKTFSVLNETKNINEINLNSKEFIETMSKNEKAFEENLSFYKIRPLYTGLIFVFYKMGIPLILSIKLMTILPIFFLLLVLYFSMKKETKNSFISFVFLMFLIFSPLILKIATTTPDSLSSFLLLSLSIAYYYQKNMLLQCFLMILLISTRTDNFIWIFLLLMWDSFSHFSMKKIAVNMSVAFLLFIFCYGINVLAGNGGLWIVYYNTLVNKLIYPLSQTPEFNFKDYFSGHIFALKYTFFTFFIIFIITILGYINFKKNPNKSIYVFNIVATTILSLFLRLILFPAYNSRYMLILFFIPIYFLVIDNKINIYNKIRYLPLFLKIRPILSSKKPPKN